jgi:hypothetical protein
MRRFPFLSHRTIAEVEELLVLRVERVVKGGIASPKWHRMLTLISKELLNNPPPKPPQDAA